MSEATVMKPRPGNRGANKSVSDLGKIAASAAEAECTVLITPSKNKERGVQLLKFGDNPLIDEASILLSMVGQIRCTAKHGDIASLRQVCIDKIRDYEANLRHLQISAEQIEAARYCMCCFIDETVLNTNWGGQSIWASDSLLSTFHSQTWGGEYFFTLLDENLVAPHQKASLLELQYLCLALGFVGKMRVTERGQDQLEAYRQQAFERLQVIHGESEIALSPQSNASVNMMKEAGGGIPIWVLTAILGVLLLSIYMTSSYFINNYSDQVFNQLNTLARWDATVKTSVERDDQQLLMLQQRLQTEVNRQLLEVQPLSDRVRITIHSSELFAPGSAEVKSALVPILQKLSRALESTSGRILITGHTDNQPIFTSRYPSNWHLSLARATAVANTMSVGTLLQGRLWPEGRGDSEPRASNDSESARALNRRVEIDLLY
ncbi:type VI secretion system protein TssL, long form [Agarivorans sp. QJM3NY_29]|uniref:type VI secretion system protein TssL, long form n=1 Tax=unclassified Agarivorans TaxID=2636026 RepID=UPI003D7E8739